MRVPTLILIVVALAGAMTGCRRRPAGTTGAAHVAAGLDTTCSLDGAGAPRCWGATMPGSRVPRPETRFTSLHASGSNACGITTTRQVVCFGTCNDGLCETPSGAFDEVAIGSGGEACALEYPDTVRCWGFQAPWRRPLPPSGLGALHGLVVGERYACALSERGAIACWGDRQPALPPPPSGTGFRALAAARYEACAIDGASAIACWGLDTGFRPPAHGTYVQIAANWERFCAIDDAKRARCFGLLKGQRETTSWHGSDLREIAVGQNHACGIDVRGRVTCWDSASNSGEGILPRNGRPLPADRSDDATIAAGRAEAPAPSSPSEDAAAFGEELLPVEPPVDSALAVEVDGRAVPITSAVAATAGGEAVSMVLSTHTLTCDASDRKWQSVAKNEIRIYLTTAALLVEPDQHGNFVRPSVPRVRIASASWPGGLYGTADGIATLTSGAAVSGARGRLVATYAASFAVGDAAASTLSIRGGIAVRGCGDRPPPGVPRLQNDLEVEVAGEHLKLRGAILRRDADGAPQLLLTSGPAICPRLLYDAPWDYSITMREGSPRQLTVNGPKLYAQHLYGSPRIVFDVLPSPAGASSEAVDVRIDDGGDSRRLPLRIHGTAHATRCP